MKITNLIPLMILGIITLGVVLWSTGVTKAQNNGNGQTMSQELANKLGIDQSKVSSAMDEIRAEKQSAKLEEMKIKLSEAVKEGKISEEQKTAILSKHTEMLQKREQERKDRDQWMIDNGLDNNTLNDLGIGMGLGRGMKYHNNF